VSVTEHGFNLKTWAEADTTRVIESHDEPDALSASPVSLANPADRTAPNRVAVQPWTAKSPLDLSPVQHSSSAELSGFCVGLRLDRRGCSFRQSTAEIRSDQ